MIVVLLLLLASSATAQVESVKFHYGDDMLWADPNFDDSGWIDGNSTVDVNAHLLETWCWARYKVRLPEKFVDPVIGGSRAVMEVYAEGRLIGGNGSLPPRLRDVNGNYRAWAIPADLAAPGKVITVALRIWWFPGRDLRRLTDFRAAPPLFLHNEGETPIYYDRVRSLVRGRQWGMSITLLLILFLWMGGQTHGGEREFRLLTLYLFLHAANAAAFSTGFYFDIYNTSFATTAFLTALGCVVYFELLAHLAGVATRWWLRLMQLINFVYFFGIALASLMLTAPSWLPLLHGAFQVLVALNLPVVLAILVQQRGHGVVSRLLPVGLAVIFLFDVSRVLGSNQGINIGDATFNRSLLGNIAFGAVLVGVRLYRLRQSEGVAARLQGQLAAAREVQELLLTRDDLVTPDYEIETAYHPADEVGGDFFRIFDCDGGGRLVLSGDVSGKGLRAAMLVSVIAGILLNRKSDEPGSVLLELNRSLHRQLQGGFVTCCVALFSNDGSATFANAGNPPAYCNGLEIDVPSGLPLGVVPDAEYPTMTRHLHPGDRIVFLSDGVVEARNAHGELFGFERAGEISLKSAHEIADAAKVWGQDDDITVVTVRRSAP
ncbi:MAG: SpoIIE family protein phosphatase [Acidobacteria bacterium]|nr:SpoIIE family protein phosphatase [Acidobacteriota bacterium]